MILVFFVAYCVLVLAGSEIKRSNGDCDKEYGIDEYLPMDLFCEIKKK